MAARHKGRKHGGSAEHAGGNPEVIKEAEEKKHGGKVHKRKDGGSVAVEGKPAAYRADRVSTHAIAGRKRGGRVGSNLSPLSTAHHDTSAPSEPKSNSSK